MIPEEQKHITSQTHLWDDALLSGLVAPHHGVALASPGLPVREDAHIVALEGMLQHL